MGKRRLRASYPKLVKPAVPVALLVPPIEIPNARELPPQLAQAAERIRDEAELITRHVVDYLGSGPTSLGEQIDWHRDFKSGYRWPEQFYLDVEVTRLHDRSDAKVPWELSRGHQLLTLARAARLFEDDRYAAELEAQWASWLDANPNGAGINWTNTMEVALRAVNWVWAVRTLEAWRPVSMPLRRRLSTSLQTHARHIALNLEGSPYLRSNHFLADMLGLLVLGWALPEDPESSGWLTAAVEAFEREIHSQVLPDGVSFEASTSYHGLCLEMFVIAHEVRALAGQSFSMRFRAQLERMLDVSRATRLAGGRTPLFGDGDSGRVLPAGFDRRPSQDEIIWLGAAALGSGRPLDGVQGEEVAWDLGLPRWHTVGRRPPAAEAPAAFPRGGLYVLSGGGSQTVVRCGGVGQNGNGGHSHNDQMSYEFATTTPLIVDSGTYAYTFDANARNRFRGTAAHNGVMIDGVEINPIPQGELFRLPGWAHVRVERWEDRQDLARLIASHDGYRNLPGAPTHQRTFAFEKNGGRLNVTDVIEGRGMHEVMARIHLAPGATVARHYGTGILVTKDAAATRISWWGVADVQVEDDFVSDRYGVKTSAPVLVARMSGPLPLRFGHRVERISDGRPAEPAQFDTTA